MAKKTDAGKGICRHCREAPVSRSRGLCWGCFKIPEIRDLYPAKNGPSASNGATAEELEALVEEQRRSMPGRQRGN